MNELSQIFMNLLKDMKCHTVSKETDFHYDQLYTLSKEHDVQALIYHQIYTFSRFPEDIKNTWKMDTIKTNAFQAMKTERFLRIYEQFNKHNLKVLVLKGLIVRSLYPEPDNRPSNDEDLYVSIEQFPLAKEILSKEMICVSESNTVSTFHDMQTGLSIELHTELFAKDSKAYGNYQDAFDNAFDSAIIHDINGVFVYSLSHDLHYLFLCLHFMKHFLHGGVGIRQILDMIFYSEAYGDMIDWPSLYQTLKDYHIYDFMIQVIILSHDLLGLDYQYIVLPDDFDTIRIHYRHLIDDIVDAGIFGKSTPERLHSSTMTLNAKAGKQSVLHSIFPSLNEMTSKYDYVNRHHFLLPVAWIQRLIHFLLHRNEGSGQKAVEIGNQRILLLKEYGIIDD